MTSFSEYLAAQVSAARIPPRPLSAGECQTSTGKRCSLCHAVNLEYADEVRLKNLALQQFWKEHVPGQILQPLVPSPVPRSYRIVTKRKAFTGRDGKTTLGLIDPDEGGRGGSFNIVRCAIEPDAHNAVYAVAGQALMKPYATLLAQSLRYVILKGEHPTAIFSVDKITPGIVKATNTLSKTLTHACKNVSGVFLYEDDSDGRYYMGDTARGHLHRVHGKPDVLQRMLQRNFLFSPLSFTQVNPAVAGLMIEHIRAFFSESPPKTFFDLYCGYGLLGLSLAGVVQKVIGAEVSPHSVRSAIANAKRMRLDNVRFIKSDITPSTLSSILKGCGNRDAVILDPPRKGTVEGVTEHIAATHPAVVIHLFCNMDILPAELDRWSASGYDLMQARPYDMFPGTPSLEVLTFLKRRAQ